MLYGLTLTQLQQIIIFVKTYHDFTFIRKEQRLKDKDDKDFTLGIKYIDFGFDTRTNEFWYMSFRGLGTYIKFTTNQFTCLDESFKDFPYNNLYDWIMAYLKGEWSDEKIMKKMYFNP